MPHPRRIVLVFLTVDCILLACYYFHSIFKIVGDFLSSNCIFIPSLTSISCCIFLGYDTMCFSTFWVLHPRHRTAFKIPLGSSILSLGPLQLQPFKYFALNAMGHIRKCHSFLTPHQKILLSLMLQLIILLARNFLHYPFLCEAVCTYSQ